MKIFAIASEKDDFSKILEDVFGKSDFEKYNYHLKSCGNMWLMPTEGWTKDKLSAVITKRCEENAKGGESPTAFLIIETDTSVAGFYYASLWDWTKERRESDERRYAR